VPNRRPMVRWVICCGLMRSGSTLQYNLTQEVVKRSGLGYGMGFVRPEDFSDLARQQDLEQGIRVIKCHRFIPEALPLVEQGNASVVLVYRDLRDVLISMSHMSGHPCWELIRRGFLQSVLDDYEQWSCVPKRLVSRYEDMCADLAGEVLRISQYLGVSVDPETARELALEYSLENQKRTISDALESGRMIQRYPGQIDGRYGLSNSRYVDPLSSYHSNHIHSGRNEQWKQEMSFLEIGLVEHLCRDWLTQRGYKLASTRLQRKLSLLAYMSYARLFQIGALKASRAGAGGT